MTTVDQRERGRRRVRAVTTGVGAASLAGAISIAGVLIASGATATTVNHSSPTVRGSSLSGRSSGGITAGSSSSHATSSGS